MVMAMAIETVVEGKASGKEREGGREGGRSRGEDGLVCGCKWVTNCFDGCK